MNKKIIILIGIVVVGLVAYAVIRKNYQQIPIKSANNNDNGSNMKLASPVFENNGMIPEKYSCDGDNINPPLMISDVPAGTQSLALIMDDPDAVSGTWTHWVLWNIAPTTDKILENSVPTEAVQGLASSGKNAYGGPCPPSGTHRYFFKLYALDQKLELDNQTNSNNLAKAMEVHILKESVLVGRYTRK